MDGTPAAAPRPTESGSLDDPAWWPAYLEQFRAACRSDHPPAVQEVRAWLKPIPAAERPLALLDLVYEHLLRGWELGRPVLLEEYVAALGEDFPEFESPTALPRDLIEHEFLVRHEFPRSGDHPRIEDYGRRFPDRPEVLEQLRSRCLDGGRYVKIKVEGKGGLGTVWAAYDYHLGRYVAIKELRPEVADQAGVLKRLRVEACVTAGLEHPAIVTVHEYRPEEGMPYYVMRLVHGRTLAEVIRDYHRLPAGAAAGERRILLHQLLKAFTTICEAVAYAHARGVVHRDLKPHNVVLGEFGETVVLDWGLAKRGASAGSGGGGVSVRVRGGPEIEGGASLTVISGETVDHVPAEEGLTQPGQVMGTPAYMPPEQAEGQIDRLGPASDVYALGAILYELLTGRPPYEGSALEVLLQVRQGPPPRPLQVQRGIPPALEAVCLRAMARQPPERYPTARDLARDVERWLADEPVSAYREPWPVRLGRWRRRHRPLVAGILTFLVLAAVVGAAWSALHSHQVEKTREQVSELATEALAEARRGNQDRARQLFAEATGLCGDQEALAALRAQTQAELRQVEQSARDRERRRITERLAVGRAEARAGNPDRASQFLSEAIGLCGQKPELAGLREEMAAQLRQVDQYRRFRQLAGPALASPAHGVGARGKADPELQQYQRALAVYRVAEDPDWARPLAGTALRREQVAEVRGMVADLLFGMAMRLALFDTRDVAGARRTRQALVLLDRLEALGGATNALWLMRMLYHRRLGENGAADRAREQMAKTPPASAQDFYLLGSYTLHRMKKPKLAVGFYELALQRAPNHFGAHFGLFFCHGELKEKAAQLRALGACLALQPNDPHLFYFRGTLHFELKKFDLAFQDFDACVRRDPNFREGVFFRARVAIIAGKWARAEKDLSHAIALDARFTAGYSWRALCRAKLRQHRRAAEDAERAIRLAPRDDHAHLFAARAYAQAVAAVQANAREPGDRQLAQKYADRSVELLERAVKLGFKEWERLAPGSDFDPVRGHPGFQQILARNRKTPD
jgi:serine/threonine protein kinase/tetratricopeptide (TPR) repeat protein